MKGFIWLPIACVAGVIIGAWGPREELRTLKANAEVERKKPQNAAEGFQAFARMANIPEAAKRGRRHRPDARPLFASANKPPARAVSAAITNAPAHRGGAGDVAHARGAGARQLEGEAWA